MCYKNIKQTMNLKFCPNMPNNIDVLFNGKKTICVVSLYKTNIECLCLWNSKNISFCQIWNVLFHSAAPREIENSKFDIMIYFVLFHAQAFSICILSGYTIPMGYLNLLKLTI